MNDKKNTKEESPSPSVSPPQAGGELEVLQKQCQEYLEGWQRAKADYANLKKESEEKQKEIASFVKTSLVIELIPVLDNFEKAIAHVPEDQKNQNWVTGIFHIKKQLEDLIAGSGLEKIKTVGEKFDPEVHEAFSSEEGEEGIILKEISSGYKLNGKTVVPAKVVVGKLEN